MLKMMVKMIDDDDDDDVGVDDDDDDDVDDDDARIILPKGNSGRSMKPWVFTSGVLYPSGCTIKCLFNPSASSPFFISATAATEISGSKWQLIPTTSAPAFAILTPQAAVDTP